VYKIIEGKEKDVKRNFWEIFGFVSNDEEYMAGFFN